MNLVSSLNSQTWKKGPISFGQSQRTSETIPKERKVNYVHLDVELANSLITLKFRFDNRKP